MSDFLVTTCMSEGCGAPLPGETGIYYCESCVERQTKAHEGERQAFDDFHAFADSVERATSASGGHAEDRAATRRERADLGG